jgi:hypothetical protein
MICEPENLAGLWKAFGTWILPLTQALWVTGKSLGPELIVDGHYFNPWFWVISC